MPVLRYLKNLNPPRVREFEEGEQCEEYGEKNYVYTRNEQEPKGNSWLSNNTIIANMPDTKIKQAIVYYRQMQHILEKELIARSVSNRNNYHSTGGSISSDVGTCNIHANRYKIKYARQYKRKGIKKEVLKQWEIILREYYEKEVLCEE
jgi:hypothetical protein